MKNNQMNNLEEMGLVNLSQAEMKEINGGGLISTIVSLIGTTLLNLGENIGKQISDFFSGIFGEKD